MAMRRLPSEDDPMGSDFLHLAVPLEERLVPVERVRRGAVGERALLERLEDLPRAVLGLHLGLVAQALADLGERDAIAAVVHVAVPVWVVLQADRGADALGERADHDVLVLAADVEDLAIDLRR